MATNHLLQFDVLTFDPAWSIPEFSRFLLQLKQRTGIDVVQQHPTAATISHGGGFAGALECLPDFYNGDAAIGPQTCMVLQLYPGDVSLFQLFRRFLADMQGRFRLYSRKTQSIIPIDLNLLALELGGCDPAVAHRLETFGLQPQYFCQPAQCIYATDSAGAVHIVNNNLLAFAVKHNTSDVPRDELSYVVASGLGRFSAMYDRALIPLSFYRFFKRSLKIINDSQFDIEDPGRKVFIKPYIFEFDTFGTTFYTVAAEGTRLLRMDKIRPGETLHHALVRVLAEDLKIADDYVGAYVAPHIEYDRDRHGVVTPRLIVHVYVERIADREYVERMKQTSWH